MSVLLNTLQLPLQFPHLMICFIPCTCISLGDSSEFSGTLFIVSSEEIVGAVVLVHATFILLLYLFVFLFFPLLLGADLLPVTVLCGAPEPLCFLSLSLSV